MRVTIKISALNFVGDNVVHVVHSAVLDILAALHGDLLVRTMSIVWQYDFTVFKEIDVCTPCGSLCGLCV